MTRNATEVPPRPAEIMTMLHEEAIAAVRAAAAAQEAGQIEERFHQHAHACEVISRLHDLLPLEGTDDYENVCRLYRRCLSLLFRFKANNATDVAQEVAALLSPLRDAWDQWDRKLLAQEDEGSEQQAPRELPRQSPLSLDRKSAA